MTPRFFCQTDQTSYNSPEARATKRRGLAKVKKTIAGIEQGGTTFKYFIDLLNSAS
jgi:hypothetical protein